MKIAMLFCALLSGSLAVGQTAPQFAVASIRPSAAPVPFENDGQTEFTPITLTMHDVTVATCIKWAYGVQDSQISGPDLLRSGRYDIMAKTDNPADENHLKLMMQSLLANRFGLAFHRETKLLAAYALTVVKKGDKLKEAEPGGKPSRQNSVMGTTAKAVTMQEFADFISGPLKTPVIDKTGLLGRYDFAIDFTPYVQAETEVGKKPDVVEIVLAAMQEELGLKLVSEKAALDVLVIDHLENPSDN